jgi:dihydrofolate reductase
VGSGVLVQTLRQHGLVDEYDLLIHPIVLGRGKRFYEEGCQTALRLMNVRTFATGMVLLQYEPEKTKSV